MKTNKKRLRKTRATKRIEVDPMLYWTNSKSRVEILNPPLFERWGPIENQYQGTNKHNQDNNDISIV